MSVEIATQSWGVVQDRTGNVLDGVQITLLNPDSSPATIYEDSGLTISLGDSVTTNQDGEIPGFVAEGSYIVQFSGKSLSVVTGGIPGPKGDTGATGAAGTSVQIIEQQGPFTSTTAGALLTPGGILYETDASGNIVAEWVKTSA